MLCISTTKRVFRTPFASQNHLFLREIKFFHLFPSQTEKKNGKLKNNTKTSIKGGLPAFMCYSKMLVVSQKLVDSADWKVVSRIVHNPSKMVSEYQEYDLTPLLNSITECIVQRNIGHKGGQKRCHLKRGNHIKKVE